MVSDLAELRRTLRKSDQSGDSLRSDSLPPAFRKAQSRIEGELCSTGRSEVTDERGNRFLIERKRA